MRLPKLTTWGQYVTIFSNLIIGKFTVAASFIQSTNIMKGELIHFFLKYKSALQFLRYITTGVTFVFQKCK